MRRMRVTSPRLRASRALTTTCAIALMLASAVGVGCTNYKKRKLETEYGPTESVVEVVAVLRRHIPDDTYRFPPATDFTGRNVYRSSLLRLESLERLHADAIRSGYMDPAIAFAKGRALERLRAYDLAAQHYRRTARFEGDLQTLALSSASICERIAEATRIGIDLQNPLDPAGDAQLRSTDPEEVIAALEERAALLGLLLPEVADSHYAYVVKEEIERADEIRASYFVEMRFALPDGQVRAVAELQRLASRHQPSKNRLKHILKLARFYDTLAHEYVRATPPESLQFDPATFQEIIDPASQLYQAVASQDGTPEKLEAQRRLEAFLAFTLQVDQDRFTQ
jgi:hypothetical protein